VRQRGKSWENKETHSWGFPGQVEKEKDKKQLDQKLAGGKKKPGGFGRDNKKWQKGKKTKHKKQQTEEFKREAVQSQVNRNSKGPVV